MRIDVVTHKNNAEELCYRIYHFLCYGYSLCVMVGSFSSSHGYMDTGGTSLRRKKNVGVAQKRKWVMYKN